MFGSSYEFLANYIQAGKRSCSTKRLIELAGSQYEKVRARVAENPKTPVDVLELLAIDPGADVRIAVGTNPKTPLEVVHKLAVDQDPTVRLGLAEDHDLPIEVLEILTEDSNPHISCRARKSLTYAKANVLNSRMYARTA